MRLRAALQCVRAFTSRRQRVHLSYGNQSSALNIEQELLDRDGTSGGGTSRGGARTRTIIDRIDPQRGLFTSSTPSHLQMSSSSGIHMEVEVCVCVPVRVLVLVRISWSLSCSLSALFLSSCSCRFKSFSCTHAHAHNKGFTF